tara:strand:+ start:10220 stop:13282 length:3063 start_codon:yes stop_codon:yes gene_type:complete
MSENDRIRVVGYAQRVFYGDGIEYRNFTDGIVGNQFTVNPDGETSLFTFGNFVTTTNYEGRASRIYSTNKFSKYYSLDTYKLLPSENKTLIKNNLNVTLNPDNTNLSNLVYFGSATEFVRVSLEKIITEWPASLYLRPLRSDGINTIVGNTVTDYSYDPVLNKSRFKVDTNFIDNKFDINFLKNGTIIDTFNEKNDTRNLTVNFNKYAILINENEYNIISFSGANTTANDFITIETKGDPFGFNGSVDSNSTYHIKPNFVNSERFFNSLSGFETNLLNRLTVPIYTSKFEFKRQEDDGTITIGEEILSWPVSDGYNIDYSTTDYINFVNKLLKITSDKDGVETNLMARFLTAQAISDFDTLPGYNSNEEETAGQKMNRTLKIYGREFDEIKKYIDSISFANVVSYDKKKNTSDQLVKYLARVLGWELTSSIVENDIISSYLKVGARSYAGYSRGLTPAEAEIELWRRLILNSSWIWKSKGTRKAIEFFFKLIGTPDGLIDFDEYVYVAKEPIDMDLFYATLENNGLDNNLSLYNVDSEGYPRFFRDTTDMYFQKGGQWYRETAGPNASQYILAGNNPHVGPYDGGKEYINQLENIIPSFTPFTLTSTTVTTGTTKLFTNYNFGLINQYTGDTYVSLQNDDGIDFSDVSTYSPTTLNLFTSIIKDPFPQIELTDCGCDIPEDDESLLIDVNMARDTNGNLIAGAIIDSQTKQCNSERFVYAVGTTDPDPDNTIDACVGSIHNYLNPSHPQHNQCSIFRYNSGFFVDSYNLYEPDDKTKIHDKFKYSKFMSPECCGPTIAPTSFAFNINSYSYYLEEYSFVGKTEEITGTTSTLIDVSAVIIDVSGTDTQIPNSKLYKMATPTWKLENCGYLCLFDINSADEDINPSFPANYVAGAEPLISCSWILNGPTLSDMHLEGGDYYLKFKKPNGEITISSDVGPQIYPKSTAIDITGKQWCELDVDNNHILTMLDPYTDKIGYVCKLTPSAKNEMNNNPTVTNSIYQTYLQRGIEKIGCRDYFKIT